MLSDPPEVMRLPFRGKSTGLSRFDICQAIQEQSKAAKRLLAMGQLILLFNMVYHNYELSADRSIE